MDVFLMHYSSIPKPTDPCTEHKWRSEESLRRECFRSFKLARQILSVCMKGNHQYQGVKWWFYRVVNPFQKNVPCVVEAFPAFLKIDLICQTGHLRNQRDQSHVTVPASKAQRLANNVLVCFGMVFRREGFQVNQRWGASAAATDALFRVWAVFWRESCG